MVEKKYITISKKYLRDKTPAGTIEKNLLNYIHKKDYKNAFKNLKALKEIYNIKYTTKSLRLLLGSEYELKKETGIVYISLFISFLKKNNLIELKRVFWKSNTTSIREIKKFIDYGTFWTDSAGVTHYTASPKSGYYRFAKRFRVIKIFREIVIL